MKKILISIYNNLKLVFSIIPKDLKRGYVKVVIFSVFLAVIEFVGVSILIPFFNEVSETKGYTYLEIFNYFLKEKIHLEKSGSIIFSLSVVIVLLLIKNFVGNYIIFKQYGFGAKVQARVSEDLFSVYFRKPYSNIVNGNSSELIRNLVQETNKLNENIIVPSFLLITDTVLIAAIGLFLLVFQPLPSLTVFLVLSLLYGTSAIILGKKLTTWGKLRFDAEGQRVKLVQEGVGAFIDIKLRDLARKYLDRYRKANNDNARYTFLLNANLQMPRHLLEVFIFFSLLVMILVNVFIGDYSNKSIIKVLGIFAIAAYRLLPALSRMTNAIQVIRFYKPSIGVFAEITNTDKEEEETSNITFDHQIELNNLQLVYGNKSVFSNISFSIKKGETVGIIGKSGSGKTSLAHCILGLINPTSGVILADGKNIGEHLKKWRNIVGYVPQNVFLLDDSIRNNIAFNFSNTAIDFNRLELVAMQAGLKEWIDSLPDGFNSVVGERGSQISGGQLQRIGIARALFQNPRILVFDEATSALDSSTEKQFLDTIESLKETKTILFITHKKAPLKICSKVLHIENGSLKTENSNSILN